MLASVSYLRMKHACSSQSHIVHFATLIQQIDAFFAAHPKLYAFKILLFIINFYGTSFEIKMLIRSTEQRLTMV